MNNREKEVLINFIVLIYQNCQKSLAKIQKTDLTANMSIEFLKEIEPYACLATELVFSNNPYTDLGLCLEDQNGIISLKFKDSKKHYINFDNFEKYKVNECRIPEDMYSNSVRDRLSFLVLLVNIMALFDLNENDHKVTHEILIKLFLVLFGNRFYDRLTDVDSIGRLYKYKSAYIKTCESSNKEKIISFVYDSDSKIEQYLFESYNTILQLDEDSTNLVSWALVVDTNDHYIDVTEFLKIIENIKNNKSCKIKDVYLPIVSKNKKTSFFDEGYYGILLDIFAHNNMSKNIAYEYSEDFEDPSFIL